MNYRDQGILEALYNGYYLSDSETERAKELLHILMKELDSRI